MGSIPFRFFFWATLYCRVPGRMTLMHRSFCWELIVLPGADDHSNLSPVLFGFVCFMCWHLTFKQESPAARDVSCTLRTVKGREVAHADHLPKKQYEIRVIIRACTFACQKPKVFTLSVFLLAVNSECIFDQCKWALHRCVEYCMGCFSSSITNTNKQT